MGKVIFNLQGLAASYHKGGVWNVVFPCDGITHHVLFKHKKKGEKEFTTPISLVDKNIRIVTTDAIPPQDPRGNKFETILDLTSPDFYDNGVKFVENPTIFKSVMTVEDAVIYVPTTMNRINIVFDIKNNSSNVIKSETAGLIAGQIELQDTGKVTMEVDGIEGFPMDFEDGDLLYFDNDCDTCTTFDSDFHYYPKIFKDSADDTISFDLLSYGFPATADPSKPLDLNDVKALLAELDGGPPPAFCDGMVISKTTDL